MRSLSVSARTRLGFGGGPPEPSFVKFRQFDEIDETGAISHEIARRSPLDGMSRHQMSQELTIHSHYLERPHTEAATSLNDRQLPWPSAKSGTLARTRRPSFFWAAITSDRGIS